MFIRLNVSISVVWTLALELSRGGQEEIKREGQREKVCVSFKWSFSQDYFFSCTFTDHGSSREITSRRERRKRERERRLDDECSCDNYEIDREDEQDEQDDHVETLTGDIGVREGRKRRERRRISVSFRYHKSRVIIAVFA